MRWFGEAREGHLGRGIVSFAGDVRQKRPHRDPLSWSYLQEAKTVILGRLEVVRKSFKKLMIIEQMEVLRVLFVEIPLDVCKKGAAPETHAYWR